MTKLDIAKKRVELLREQMIKIKVNIGRNRFTYYDGCIDQLHPNIFTVKTSLYGTDRTLSFTYVDVLSKIVRFYPLEESSHDILS